MNRASFSEQELRDLLEELDDLQEELATRSMLSEPLYYGLPDLLFKKGEGQGWWDAEDHKVIRPTLDYEETDEQYKERQDKVLKDFIENKLFFFKDGKLKKVHLIPLQFKLLCDFVFNRERYAILWGPRGGGKSLTAALIIWIKMVYYNQSVVDMAASGEQAQAIYKYAAGFFKCFPTMKKDLLGGDPLKWKMVLTNSVTLYCCESHTQAVSKHEPGFVADESCSGDPRKDKALVRAMQGCYSEEDHWVILLSTMHHGIGLFVDYWDNAKEYGYVKYKWDIFDLLRQCDHGLEHATAEDLLAIESYCKTQCQFSITVEYYDEATREMKMKPFGCLGKGRTAQGWYSYRDVDNIYRKNGKSEAFWHEHGGKRPHFKKDVFGEDLVSSCVIKDGIIIPSQKDSVVGIDWGMGQTFMTYIMPMLLDPKLTVEEALEIEATRRDMVKDAACGLGVVDIRAFSHQLEDEAIRQLELWTLKYGIKPTVYADISHPFNNKRLATHGYKVVPVAFNKYKEIGVQNVYKWMTSGYFKILAKCQLLHQQLKNLKRDPKTGKIVKSGGDGVTADHGPDSLMCALLRFPFSKWQISLIKKEDENRQTLF